jgi:hypothetical protein
MNRFGLVAGDFVGDSRRHVETAGRMLSTICQNDARSTLVRRTKAKQENRLCLRAVMLLGHSDITI